MSDTPLPEWQMKIDVTGRTAELTAENERLRKREFDYKHQIHVLRQRCESLVRELESLRNEIARLKGQTCCKETP